MTTEKKSPLIWIIAGEASGDLYGAQLAKNVRQMNPDARIAGMGGVKMRDAGVDILVDSTELGVVGIVEVLGIIFTFIRIMLFLTKEAAKQCPDVVLMVDYPGFNIRFAKRLWKMGIPVVWYISPQVWVWRKSNIPKYAKYCKKMLVIFPFETEVWEGTGLEAQFTGHPLIEVIRERQDPAIRRDPDRVLLLPGSRKSETSRLVEPFLAAAKLLSVKNPDLKFMIAAPREKTYRDIRRQMELFKQKNGAEGLEKIELSCGETARWMQEASTGLAASGTVTVESAISDLPLVVAYKLNPVTFFMARWFLVGKLFRGFFTMPNIIMDKCVFEEFLQDQVTPETLANAMEKILPGGERRDAVMADMQAMRDALSCGAENATANAAAAVMEVAMR